MNFHVDIRYIENDGRKVRLLSESERSSINKRIKELEGSKEAEFLARIIKDNDEISKEETVCYLVCFVPSYEEKLVITANALSKLRQVCGPLDLEVTNEALESFRLENQAKTLVRKVVDSGGTELGTWDTIWNEWPEEWRQPICNLINTAITLSEEERAPLFCGPKESPGQKK